MMESEKNIVETLLKQVSAKYIHVSFFAACSTLILPEPDGTEECSRGQSSFFQDRTAYRRQ